jgi:MarR family 2-MHQ and catechol resistance regulon transcriptional repressor
VVVGNLARRGLVRRHRGPRDRRFVTVTLTDKGRRLIGGIFPRHVRHVVRELGALSPPEQAELGRLCRQLGLARRPERARKEKSNGTQSHPLRLARAL